MFDPSKIKAVLWDLDDTLYSRTEGAKRMFPGLFREHLYRDREDGFLTEAVAYFLSRCPRGSVVHPEAFAALAEKYPFDRPFVYQNLLSDYYDHFREFIVPSPEPLSVIQKLRTMDIRTGIITNITPELLESQKRKVAALGISDLFDSIIYSAEFGVHKPDRRIFDRAAKALGVSNDQCLFVGDDPASDISGALDAGMEALWLDTGTGLLSVSGKGNPVSFEEYFGI